MRCRKGILAADWREQSRLMRPSYGVSYKGKPTYFHLERSDLGAVGTGQEPQKEAVRQMVCCPCVIYCRGNVNSKETQLWECTTDTLYLVLGGHISTKSTLYSDEGSSYRKFSKRDGLRPVQKGGAVKGILHIQYLNAYHNKLKAFVASFRDVSLNTSTINLYENVVEHKGESIRDKTVNILNFAAQALFEESCLAVPLHPSKPFL